jgi:ABC-type uncharacterized transport system permease subunit
MGAEGASGAAPVPPASPPPPARGGWAGPKARQGAQELALQLGAAALSVVFLLVLLGALDYPVVASFEAIRDGALATNEGVASSLMQSVPVILTGVGVWFAYKVGLFNIGADGQLVVGGVTAFVVAANGPDLPGPILIAAALVFGALAGSLWALIAGWLRVARGANEIISTIMLNFIALSLGDRLISGALADEGATSPQTASIPESTELGNLHASIPIGWAFVIAVIATAGLVFLMQRTGLGLRLRTIGLNPSAAERAGLQVNRLRLLSMALSGGVAGLAGGLVVLGMRQYLAPGWAPAWGFVGILVAFLALRFPALIPVWGVIFGMLATSAPVLKAQASVPDGIVTIIQVLPVLSLFLLYRTRSLIKKGGHRWSSSSTR